MTLTTLRLSRSGLSVALRERGAGSPLILIHGVGMQSAAWHPQFAALQAKYRVIAVDLPGHGGSDPIPLESQLPDYVAWFHDVVETLGLGSVSVAGHSMGAMIACGFAVEHEALAKRIALLNGVYRRNDAAKTAVTARAAEIRAGKVDLETPLARWFGNTQNEIAARAQVAGWLGEVNQEGYATAYTAFANGDATYGERLQQIACPFLAITGDGDPNSTPEMSQEMASQAQNGTAITIKGHRHMVNLTAPDQVNSALMTWLDTPVSRKEGCDDNA